MEAFILDSMVSRRNMLFEQILKGINEQIDKLFKYIDWKVLERNCLPNKLG